MLPDEYSLISCDCENIVIETVKEVENGKGIIIRLYDAWNRKSKSTLNFGFEAKQVWICDMLENPLYEIGRGRTMEIEIKNFEILTLMLTV